MKPTSCLCAILASSASSVRGKDCTHMPATPILSGKLGVCCRALPSAAMAFSVACPLVSSLQRYHQADTVLRRHVAPPAVLVYLLSDGYRWWSLGACGDRVVSSELHCLMLPYVQGQANIAPAGADAEQVLAAHAVTPDCLHMHWGPAVLLLPKVTLAGPSTVKMPQVFDQTVEPRPA